MLYVTHNFLNVTSVLPGFNAENGTEFFQNGHKIEFFAIKPS